MRNTIKLDFSKSEYIDNAGTMQQETHRWLDANLIVTGLDCMRVAEQIMSIMEQELDYYGLTFSTCPDIERDDDENIVVYIECISVPFTSGHMAEYKKAIKEAYKIAKAEIKTKTNNQSVNTSIVTTVDKAEEISSVTNSTEKKYHIWNGTNDIKGQSIVVDQQLRIDLYNMTIDEIEELQTAYYIEYCQGHTEIENGYTRLYIKILDIHNKHVVTEQSKVSEVCTNNQV